MAQDLGSPGTGLHPRFCLPTCRQQDGVHELGHCLLKPPLDLCQGPAHLRYLFVHAAHSAGYLGRGRGKGFVSSPARVHLPNTVTTGVALAQRMCCPCRGPTLSPRPSEFLHSDLTRLKCPSPLGTLVGLGITVPCLGPPLCSLCSLKTEVR